MVGQRLWGEVAVDNDSNEEVELFINVYSIVVDGYGNIRWRGNLAELQFALPSMSRQVLYPWTGEDWQWVGIERIIL